jgi:uncharacterized metal-binding protein YceD (DUF177 family)
MKIALREINDQEIVLSQDIPARLWEIDSIDIKFLDNIHVVGKFRRVSNEVIVDADLTLQQEAVCARCLAKTKESKKQHFSKSYNFQELGEFLDIDSDLREEILLNSPMKVLCKQDCKGI